MGSRCLGESALVQEEVGVAHGDLPEWRWFKSSYTSNGGECVEVAYRPEGVRVRDSQRLEEGDFLVSRQPWCGFLAAVVSGDIGGERCLPQ
ncbi:DUF397 domain-containing protein [Streptomyces sp. NPDC051561]|uniref:DUF397 domain-containing protein n=1 Tax=Streptomyces sp. NPDC051561 TaxID=3365658 RepID=UPI0037A496AD